MARFRGGGLEKGIANDLQKKIYRKLARGIQEAAINTMNGLAEAGPTWSGEFAASWRFVAEGESGGDPGNLGDLYKYSKKDIRVTTIEKHINRGVNRFQFINTSPHANEAIDGVQGTFIRPSDPPIASAKLELGDERSNPSFRHEIGNKLPSSTSLEEAPAARTAEPDWYITYTKGGGLQLDLGRGFSAGFKGEF